MLTQKILFSLVAVHSAVFRVYFEETERIQPYNFAVFVGCDRFIARVSLVEEISCSPSDSLHETRIGMDTYNILDEGSNKVKGIRRCLVDNTLKYFLYLLL